MQPSAIGFKVMKRWPKWQSTSRKLHSSPIQILPEVNEAIKSGRPVVALESTIVAHGMPYPQNLELAKDVSQILRSKGVIPATIAVKNGVFKAGLHPDELEDLAKAGEDGRAIKCSTRDLPLVASNHYRERYVNNTMIDSATTSGCSQWGATTVAATMRLAHAAGIATFVTGGTGGVHRGGELTLDISTDLIELSRTPVIVISAGVKSILDIKRTLEVLETFGVPTGSWKSEEFPAFFSPISGIKSPATFNDAMDVACSYVAGKNLGMLNGMLVAVPNYDPAGSNVETAIQEALDEASALGIDGRDITPFILKAVAKKTGGDSLRSNMSLVKNNASVGADIAVAVSKMSTSYSIDKKLKTNKSIDLPRYGVTQSRVVCVGGAVVDTIAKSNTNDKIILGTSNPGKIRTSDGGVARNIAETLGRLGTIPIFYTAVGNDYTGQSLLQRLSSECQVLITSKSVNVVDGVGTAQYYALNDQASSLVGAIADMEVLTHIPIPEISDLDGVEVLVLDANLPPNRILECVQRGIEAGCKVCFEPTSVPKAQALMKLDFMKSITYAFPNEDELSAMASEIETRRNITRRREFTDEELHHNAKVVLSEMKSDGQLIITLGARGVLLAQNDQDLNPIFTHFPIENVVDVRSSNGPGDTLCGAYIHAKSAGMDSKAAVRFGMKAAALSLGHENSAISPLLSSLKLSKV